MKVKAIENTSKVVSRLLILSNFSNFSKNLTVNLSDQMILELKRNLLNKIGYLIEANLAISWIVFYYATQLTFVKLFNESSTYFKCVRFKDLGQSLWGMCTGTNLCI